MIVTLGLITMYSPTFCLYVWVWVGVWGGEGIQKFSLFEPPDFVFNPRKFYYFWSCAFSL